MLQNGVEFDVDKRVPSTFFTGWSTGVFVDVAAARPDYLPVSAVFCGYGWRIFSIEPNPEFADFHWPAATR